MTKLCVLAVTVALAALAAMPSSAGAWPQSCCLPWYPPGEIVLSADGEYAYSASYDITLALKRDPATGVLKVMDAYEEGGAAMELVPDGSALYVAQEHAASVVGFRRDQRTGLLEVSGRWSAPGFSQYYDIQSSRDGRQLYLADHERDAIVILDRDADSGALRWHGEVRSGDPGVEGLRAPDAIAVSADDRFVYVSGGYGGVVAFARRPDGGLDFVNRSECFCGSGDIALTPDGRRLFLGPLGPGAVERDPDTGALGATRGASFSSSGSSNSIGDAAVAPTPDGSGGYVADEFNRRLYQFAYGPDGFTFVKAYREGVDGEGISQPRGVVISPDGRNVYVPSAEQSSGPGRIAVFRRDPATNLLTFVALFEGPVFDGRRPEDQKPPTLRINGGDEFTNDPDVELTISNIDTRSTFGVLISNDGGFGAGSQRFEADATSDKYVWRLATSGPERLPKTVYVRVDSVAVRSPGVITDEIVLDERPPAVDSATILPAAPGAAKAARASGRRLRIRAHDRLSGVGRMQITRKRRHPGRWHRFSRSARVPRGHGAVWVRVRDRAGNPSRWRRAGARRPG